jgi:hypothetical protein
MVPFSAMLIPAQVQHSTMPPPVIPTVYQTTTDYSIDGGFIQLFKVGHRYKPEDSKRNALSGFKTISHDGCVFPDT